MRPFTNADIEEKFKSYPKNAREELLLLRELIYEVTEEESTILGIQEELKWGEPSYITKNGSTLRMDYKAKKPQSISLYFNCKSKLVETFRELFSDRFSFEGNREMILKLGENFDTKALKYCILLTLTYHDRKHLVMLDD